MGNSLPYVDLGTGRTAKSLAVGLRYSCALLDNDRIKCWGTGNGGENGAGTGANLGDSPGSMGNALPYVDLGTGRTVKTLHSDGAGSHTCVVLDNGLMKCWGAGGYQVGPSYLEFRSTRTKGAAPGQMGEDLPFILTQHGPKLTVTKVSPSSWDCTLDGFSASCEELVLQMTNHGTAAVQWLFDREFLFESGRQQLIKCDLFRLWRGRLI